MNATLKKTAVVAGAGAIIGAGVYTFWLRHQQNRWGATDAETTMPLPGDEVVANPNMNSTRAIEIEADPEDVWPWLVQIGKGRGGLYSYDWLDMAFKVLDKPSSEEILPQYQNLKAGDVIPIGDDESTKDDFYVHYVEPHRALVVGANDPEFREKVSWAMVLIPVEKYKTRLIMRVRGDIPKDAKGVLMYALLEPSSFIMLRKQMLNLKRLAEKSRAQRSA